MARSHGAARRSQVWGVSLLAAAFLAAFKGTAEAPSSAFVGTTPIRLQARLAQVRVGLKAEEEPKSEALVKVTEENAIAAAGAIGAGAGFLFGGLWGSALLFALASYLTRRDDDIGTALKGASTAALEALNFGAYVNGKYEVTNTIGSKINDTIEEAKAKPETKEVASTVSSALKGLSEAVESADKDLNLKESVGSALTSGGDLANQAVAKAVEFNDKYKVVDTLTDKVKTTVDEAVTKTKKEG